MRALLASSNPTPPSHFPTPLSPQRPNSGDCGSMTLQELKEKVR